MQDKKLLQSNKAILTTINQETLRILVDEKYQLMVKKQVENPNLIIPKNFQKFIESQILMKFLMALYDYCQQVTMIDKKQKILEIEAQSRINAPPQLLSSEAEIISQKLKVVSEIYCIIILKLGEYNVMYRDQNFFETLIYFVSQVFKKLFNKEDFKSVEEELNRIFRTNTFNLIKKRHFEDEKLKRFPILKEYNGKETVEAIIQKMEKRSKIPKFNWKFQMMNEKSDLKPYFIRQTPHGSVNSRSPIIAMIMPSAKERLFQYEKERKYRQASFAFQSKFDQVDINMLMMDDIRHSRSNTMDRRHN